MSKRSGYGYARSSRHAAPVIRSTGSFAWIVTPCHSDGCIVNRPWYCDGAQ